MKRWRSGSEIGAMARAAVDVMADGWMAMVEYEKTESAEAFNLCCARCNPNTIDVLLSYVQ